MNNANAIDRLIVACRDDEHTLRHETRLVDAGRVPVLTRLADERRGFADELRALPSAHEKGLGGTWAAVLRGLGRDLRTAVTGISPSDSVTACRQSRQRVEEAYDQALALAWPDAVRAILLTQSARVQAAAKPLLAIQF